MHSNSVVMCVGMAPVVVLMVVWIAWWACVDVLFLVPFHTRPPIAVSDKCMAL